MTLKEEAHDLIEKSSEADVKKVIAYLSSKLPKKDDAKKSVDKSENVVIYTDGGCHGNPGPGGWGVVVIADGEVKEASGGEKLTTNNRMELTAAITALSIVANTPSFSGRKIEINTDSQYVKNGITGWVAGWKKNGWKTSAKKDVLNKDLWEKLDELNTSVKPLWKWVKGHAGVEFNERCDQLCQEEIAKFE